MFIGDSANVFTIHLFNMLTCDSANMLTSDLANMLTIGVTNMLTSDSIIMLNSDSGNMFTRKLEKQKIMVWYYIRHMTLDPSIITFIFVGRPLFV